MTFNIGHFATRRIKQVHFVGIGGSGMGGIAEVMVNLGYQVHGSDIQQNGDYEKISWVRCDGLSLNMLQSNIEWCRCGGDVECSEKMIIQRL